MIDATGRDIDLEIDGGISEETVHDAVSAGANILVAGSAIFGAKDYAKAIAGIRSRA